MLPILLHMIMGRLFLGESAPSHWERRNMFPFSPEVKGCSKQPRGLELSISEAENNSSTASQMSRTRWKPGPPSSRCLWSKVCFRDSENQPQNASKQHTQRRCVLFPGQGNRQQALLFSRDWTIIVTVPTKPPCAWSSQGHLESYCSGAGRLLQGYVCVNTSCWSLDPTEVAQRNWLNKTRPVMGPLIWPRVKQAPGRQRASDREVMGRASWEGPSRLFSWVSCLLGRCRLCPTLPSSTRRLYPHRSWLL